MLASLNHPNIVHIHGLEELPSTDSTRAASKALVLELVDGPTLADVIANGPIPLDFGLANAMDANASSALLSMSPTITLLASGYELIELS